MSTIVVCELSEIVATGIEVLVTQAACKVVARCRSGVEVLRMAELHRPELIIASSSALGDDAIVTIRTLRAENPRPRIIILIDTNAGILLDTNAGPTATNLADFNVDGFLLRQASSAALVECIKSVQEGRPWLDPDLLQHIARTEHIIATDNLTSREREIMSLVALGMSNKEIARQATLSEGTVKMYLHNILTKLRLTNRTQLATFAHSRCSARHSQIDKQERLSA